MKMETNVAPQAPHPNVLETVRILTNLLAVRNCKLANEEANWRWVTGTLIASGYDPLSAPPQKLANVLLTTINATLATNGLRWAVKPARLIAEEQANKPIKKYADADNTPDALKAKQQADEARIVKRKAEGEILITLRQKIASFTIMDCRRGRVNMPYSEKLREGYTTYVDKQVERGVAPSAIAEKVIAHMNEEHAKAERAAERT
jgi:hypothetical protein